MPKYNVYASVGATKFIGTFEAKDEDDAKDKAEQSDNCDAPSLCCECAHKVDIGDLYDFVAELED